MIWRRGNGYLSAQASKFARTPPGHPEGYLEAFANIYTEAFRDNPQDESWIGADR